MMKLLAWADARVHSSISTTLRFIVTPKAWQIRAYLCRRDDAKACLPRLDSRLTRAVL